MIKLNTPGSIGPNIALVVSPGDAKTKAPFPFSLSGLGQATRGPFKHYRYAN